MAPKIIEGAGFDTKLSRKSSNIEHTAQFLARGTSAFSLENWIPPAGYDFRISLDRKQIRLIHSGETVYYVKLKNAADILPNIPYVTQIGVWRSQLPEHHSAVTGLAARVFNWLLINHIVVISDTEQTRDGARFWSERIRYAISYPNQHVYYWDGTQEDAEPIEITDQDTFSDIWEGGKFWGVNPDVHPHRLLIITARLLNQPA